MQKQLLFISLITCVFGCAHPRENENEQTEAGKAFEYWSMARMYPDGKLHTDRYAQAFEQAKAMTADRGPQAQWEGIGPKNIGGRTLCLAIHPLDSNILFLGSAAGGIWKSTSGGRGVNAWERIETGFPVLGVGCITIDPSNPSIMYAGTGELYSYENAMPNIAYRTTRGTYGIGILKSTDGGNSWQKSLDWSYQELTGIQEIRINPVRPQTVWASTSKGLLRSYDAGTTWTTVMDKPMAVDLEISPNDTSRVFVTFGSHDDNADSGIFRSTDGGNTFQKITTGLPASYSGKALLTIAPSNPDLIYISIGNVTAQEGLYKSTNGGTSFVKINSTDVSKYQGWYSHDIAVKPDNPQRLIWVGIDAWLSSDGGTNFSKATNWYDWFFGQVPVGGPEGPGTYLHADIHHVYFHPLDPNKVYAVSDGGLFVSSDAGGSWEGRNGGYQTQQFYANFSNSSINPDIAIGGMQDNATAVYTGSPAWTRGIGGDGCCTAINPFDDNIMIGASQYGNLAISSDAGQSWNGFPANTLGSTAAFVAPFEYAPSNPDVFYLGEDILERLDFSVGEWVPITPSNSFIITIGVSNTNSDDVFFSTAPTDNQPPGVYRVNAATLDLQTITGLPNRMFTDITRHPTDNEKVYAVCGGFGSNHIWRTTNGGTTWTSIDNGIPDVPANSILIDPLEPTHLYLANDIGVWFSNNDGTSWEFLSAGGPQAMLAMHLSISADRKLRVATHGLGIWQTDMVFEPVGTANINDNDVNISIFPNPVKDQLSVLWKGNKMIQPKVSIVDLQGKIVLSPQVIFLLPNTPFTIPVGQLPKGTYAVIWEVNGRRISRKMVK